MIETVKKIVEPLSRRVSLLVSRCILNFVDDASKTQTAQAEFFAGEVHDNSEIWQQYGFTSVPPNGSEGVALFMGGERQSPLIIATENKEKRLNNLKEGEVAIYSDCGDYFQLKKENSLKIQTQQFKINTKSISIKNDSCELIDILSTLCDLLSKDKTNTILGPQPLLGAPLYSQLKIKLDSFKG